MSSLAARTTTQTEYEHYESIRSLVVYFCLLFCVRKCMRKKEKRIQPPIMAYNNGLDRTTKDVKHICPPYKTNYVHVHVILKGSCPPHIFMCILCDAVTDIFFLSAMATVVDFVAASFRSTEHRTWGQSSFEHKRTVRDRKSNRRRQQQKKKTSMPMGKQDDRTLRKTIAPPYLCLIPGHITYDKIVGLAFCDMDWIAKARRLNNTFQLIFDDWVANAAVHGVSDDACVCDAGTVVSTECVRFHFSSRTKIFGTVNASFSIPPPYGPRVHTYLYIRPAGTLDRPGSRL